MNLRIKAVLVTLGWAVALEAFTLWAIFQGLLLPRVIGLGGGLLAEVLNGSPVVIGVFYAGILGASVLAALSLSDLGPAIVSFFAAYLLAAILNVIILALPDATGAYYDPYGILTQSSVSFTLTAFFPLPFLAGLSGTLLGFGLGEKFL